MMNKGKERKRDNWGKGKRLKERRKDKKKEEEERNDGERCKREGEGR